MSAVKFEQVKEGEQERTLHASRIPAISSGVCTLAAYNLDGFLILMASSMFSSRSNALSPSAVTTSSKTGQLRARADLGGGGRHVRWST